MAAPSYIGAFALDDDLSGAVVALRTGIYGLDFASGRPTLLAPAPFDPEFQRFNEGAVARPAVLGGCDVRPAAIGCLRADCGLVAQLHSAGELKPESDAAELRNGMASSADGRRFLLSERPGGHLEFDFEPDTGQFSCHRTVAAIRGRPSSQRPAAAEP